MSDEPMGDEEVEANRAAFEALRADQLYGWTGRVFIDRPQPILFSEPVDPRTVTFRLPSPIERWVNSRSFAPCCLCGKPALGRYDEKPAHMLCVADDLEAEGQRIDNDERRYERERVAAGGCPECFDGRQSGRRGNAFATWRCETCGGSGMRPGFRREPVDDES